MKDVRFRRSDKGGKFLVGHALVVICGKRLYLRAKPLLARYFFRFHYFTFMFNASSMSATPMRRMALPCTISPKFFIRKPTR